MKKDLIQDLRNKGYTIIIDKSTDISTQKHVCILVRYFGAKSKDIVTRFVGLLPVVKATGESLFNAIEQEINCFGQNLQICIAFASDGASNMIGCNNPVWSKLKEASHNCVQFRCICHSLALCIQHAVAKLPCNIGFLLSEKPNWFRHCEVWREAYNQLFDVMNTSNEFLSPRITPLPFVKPSFTGWLAKRKVMYNILTNWEELKAYFTSAELAKSRYESKHKARILKDKLFNKKHHFFLICHTYRSEIWARKCLFSAEESCSAWIIPATVPSPENSVQ